MPILPQPRQKGRPVLAREVPPAFRTARRLVPHGGTPRWAAPRSCARTGSGSRGKKDQRGGRPTLASAPPAATLRSPHEGGASDPDSRPVAPGRPLASRFPPARGAAERRRRRLAGGGAVAGICQQQLERYGGTSAGRWRRPGEDGWAVRHPLPRAAPAVPERSVSPRLQEESGVAGGERARLAAAGLHLRAPLQVCPSPVYAGRCVECGSVRARCGVCAPCRCRERRRERDFTYPLHRAAELTSAALSCLGSDGDAAACIYFSSPTEVPGKSLFLNSNCLV